MERFRVPKGVLKRHGPTALALGSFVGGAAAILSFGGDGAEVQASTGLPHRAAVPMVAADGVGRNLVIETPAGTVTLQPTPTTIRTETPTPTEIPFTPYQDRQRASEMASLINQYRNDRGLSSMNQHAALQQAAEQYAQLIAEHQWLSPDHIGPDGSTVAQRYASYPGPTRSENVVTDWSVAIAGLGSAQELVDWWKNSPGHNSNLLAPFFDHYGSACFVIRTIRPEINQPAYSIWCVLALGGLR